LLDRWVLARLNQIVPLVTQALEDSDPLSASLAIAAFLDDLSNWYVRRSRRRFWKSKPTPTRMQLTPRCITYWSGPSPWLLLRLSSQGHLQNLAPLGLSGL
jgi:isoleucyl-tRNA synthetase